MMYDFQPLAVANLHLLEKWLQQPHVKEFWNDHQSWKELSEKYLSRMSSDVIKQFIIYYNDIPIGYIQFYWASRVGNGQWEGFSEKVVGIDQYIGEPDFVGRGHGSKLISEFISYLKSNYDISKVITDPSPDNQRAIRCYEKAGFRKIDEIETPYGRALLMEFQVAQDSIQNLIIKSPLLSSYKYFVVILIVALFNGILFSYIDMGEGFNPFFLFFLILSLCIPFTVLIKKRMREYIIKIEGDIVSINTFSKVYQFPIKSIFAIDWDKTFYIHFSDATGNQEGLYLGICDEDKKRLLEYLIEKGIKFTINGKAV